MEPAEDMEMNRLARDAEDKSSSVSSPANIDLTIVSEEDSMDYVDAPSTPGHLRGLIPENFSRLLPDRGGFSRRSSDYSSTTSIDTVHLTKIAGDKDRSTLPQCQEEMESFVRDLAESYKKMSHLKEALTRSWARLNLSHQCSGSNATGDTILHVAARLGEAKVVSAISHINASNGGDVIDVTNINGDTALHLACEHGHEAVTEGLLKHGAAMEKVNSVGFTPLQIAAIKLQHGCAEILLRCGADHKVITSESGETVLHLACRGAWIKYEELKEALTELLNQSDSVAEAHKMENGAFCAAQEETLHTKESQLHHEVFPFLRLLLDAFKKNPEMVVREDDIQTSPGTLMHYFVCLNYLEGVNLLLKEPFLVNPSALNKNGLSSLWIAAWYNHTRIGIALLERDANANDANPKNQVTPLHCAIYGYHIDRVQETCDFVDALLAHKADPRKVDASGETPAHLVIGTLDFKVMSKFIDYLGPESLQLEDDSGNTLFHYAVACLDESTIFQLVEKGANLMSKNTSEVERLVNGESGAQGLHEADSATSIKEIRRTQSITIHRLPLQEAMKNGNSKNYFNALRRLDFNDLASRWTPAQYEEFICAHLIAAARDVRPDIVRLLFQQIEGVRRLHRILLYCDKSHEDETFTKTALEWAVENNDRLCTTEILHQEYECHRSSKVAGLTCLRRQLTGDELLMWTVETFTMFYEKTFAQRTVIPLLGLIPLFVSISSFVYDYYSDIELTLEYFRSSNFSQHGRETSKQCDVTDESENPGCLDPDQVDEVGKFGCYDIRRTPHEFQTALVMNITCICLPLFIFFAMCARELLPLLHHLQDRCSGILGVLLTYSSWILLALVCAPFFILYVAVSQVYYRFRHRRAKRKNLFRRRLQESEYFWGISRTAEAGLESCGQLILQVWLLSSDFKSLSGESFSSLVDKTYNGFIFFLSFGVKAANDNEKSLGKMFMSLMALVFSVAACYRTLKRGALKMSNTFFIYMSLFCQVFARIFSLALYFFAVRDFIPAIPIFLVCHFLIVFAIKWTFERTRHSGGVMSYLVSIINIFASSLVYVRIVPINRPRLKDGSQCTNHASHAVLQRSTFFVQSLFFLLALVENVVLAMVPLIHYQLKGRPNRAVACLGIATLWDYTFRIVLLCVGSWVFHTLYYKYMGHPWSAINGPNVSKRHFRFFFHVCGQERHFDCSCVPQPQESRSSSLSDCHCCCGCCGCRSSGGYHCKVTCQIYDGKDDCVQSTEDLRGLM